MGGRGSGRGRRPVRLAVDECQVLDLRAQSVTVLFGRTPSKSSCGSTPAALAGLFVDNGSPFSVWPTYKVPQRPMADLLFVAIDTVPTPLGGVRRWMRCPRCDRRAAALYLPPDSHVEEMACRMCHRLAYRSQRRSPRARWERRAHAIEWRLAMDGAFMGTVPAREQLPLDLVEGKPKWMRWRTFYRLLDEAVDLQNAVVLHTLDHSRAYRALVKRDRSARRVHGTQVSSPSKST
jgi:hypothetical protein